MCSNPGLPASRRLIGHGTEVLTEGTLEGVWWRMTSFALLAKDLALEPGDLAAQVNDFLVFLVQYLSQLGGRQSHRFRGGNRGLI
jgi:hypothetical protein